MKSRRGVSLVELLVVIATSSVMVTLGSTTIFMLLRAEAAGTKSLFTSTSMSRLATAFRDDVSTARRVELKHADDAAVTELVLVVSERRQVTYRIEPRQVVRATSPPAKQNVGVNIGSIERYRLPDGVTKFEVPEQHELADRPLLSLIHRLELGKRTKNDLQSPSRELRIVAQLGLDRRFEKPKQRATAKPKGNRP